MIKPIPWQGMQLSSHAHEVLSQQVPPKKPVRYEAKSLAVIIPYRDRQAHLENLLPTLKRAIEQATNSYAIIVAEQADEAPFNKGALCNAAVMCLEESFDYICFHDVDFLPVNIDYRYSSAPVRPFSQTRGKKIYQEEFHEGRLKRLLDGDPTLEEKEDRLATVYPHFWGGVFFLPFRTFFKVNGFGNAFPFWGFEDLDFLLRLFAEGEVPFTDPEGIFQLQTHPHVVQTGKPWIEERILENLERYRKHSKHFDFPDGLSTLEFELMQAEKTQDFTRLCLAKFRQKS